MKISDLRRPAQTAARDPRLPTPLPAATRDAAERLFSAGVTTPLLALFAAGLLRGRRVVTEAGPPAPIAVTSVEVEPFVRRLVETLSYKQVPVSVDPDPRIRITLGLFWEALPFRVLEPNLVEVDAALFAEYPVDPVHPYRFVYAGLNLGVTAVLPNSKGNKLRFRLSGPLAIAEGREAVGSVHGGALQCVARVEQTTDSSKASAMPGAQDPSDFFRSPTDRGGASPVYGVEVVGYPAEQALLHLIATNRTGRTTLRVPVAAEVARPPLPASLRLVRDENRPPRPPSGSAVVRVDSRISLAVELQRSAGAAILGALVSLSSPGGPARRSVQPDDELTYISFPLADVRWQTEPVTIRGTPGVSSEKAFAPPQTRTVVLDLGPAETSGEVHAAVVLVDELARTSARLPLVLPAGGPVYLPSPELGEEFGRLAQLAMAPLEVDIEGVAARFVQHAEEIVRLAETRIESALEGQPSVQQTLPTP